MYAPSGFDSDSSGEETTPPPTPAPPPPPKPRFKFRSLFTSTKKLEARTPRQGEELKKDEEKEPPGPMKKRVRIFAGELLDGQKGSKVEGLTTTTGEKIEPEPPSPEGSKQGSQLEPAGLTEQTAVNPVASEILVLLRQLVVECHATNKNTDPEPKADSISQGMNEGSSANDAEPEKKIGLPAPEAIIATDREFDRPIDTEPAQETHAPQHRPSHLLPSVLGRQQYHLADNYFYICEQVVPSASASYGPPYGYYPQLASPYLWTAYHSRLQWWPFDHHSTSDEQKTVTKLSPPHFTLFDPVISESTRLPPNPYIRKYEAAHNRALKDYKEPGLEQGERKRRKEKVRSAERRLNEARQALEDTEREEGIDDDSSDPSSSESKEVRGSQDEPSKETNSSPETQYAGYQGENDTTLAADNPTKPNSTVTDESRVLERLETYVLKYRQSYNIAVKRSRVSEDDDERKRGKAIVKETQGKLREAMQALSTAKWVRGNLTNSKNEEKVQRGLDKGKGRILDDVNEKGRPAAEKESSVKKKLDKWEGRAINVGGEVEEPKRTKEVQEEEGQHLQKVPMEISPSVQEPIYEILMDENVVENGSNNVNPSLQNRNFGDQRFSNINRSAIERRDKKLIKETLIEAKWAQVLRPASSTQLPSNITTEPNKAIEHCKIKYAAFAKSSSDASLEHEGKQVKMKEADRVKKKKIKTIMSEDEAGEQASKAKDVSKEAKCSATKPFNDMKQLKEYNTQVEVVDIETLLELAKVKYSKLTKAAKEETIGDETRRKRKAKVEKQALIVQAMMEAMDKKDNECKRQAVTDNAEENSKTGKDEMSSMEKAQILSRCMIFEEVEQAIGQVKEERQIEKLNNSTTEEKESRQCPLSGCEIATSCKKWAPLHVTKGKTPVNNPVRPRPANAIRHPSVQLDVRRWLDGEDPEELTWSKTMVSLAKCVDLCNTILYSLQCDTRANSNHVGTILSRLIDNLLRQQDLVDSMRKLAGHGHDAQLEEFIEHLAIIKGFLEKNMSSGLTDYFEREVRKEIASIRQIEKRKERKFEEEEEDKRKGFLELLDMLLAFIVSPDNHQIIIEKKDDGPGIQANETPVSTQLTFTEHNYETVASEGQFPLSEKTIVDSPPHKLSDLLHFPHRPLSPSVSRLTPIMLSKNSHSPQPEPIKRTASHKSAANAINLSHFPVKLSQVTQDSLDDNSSWKRPPVERTKLLNFLLRPIADGCPYIMIHGMKSITSPSEGGRAGRGLIKRSKKVLYDKVLLVS
ncbi:hypothetical protein I306_04088 [Cryptococcus gattii EJB2]|uniref:Uncharacterized protein n=1 Tax=Cryptococcus gattii EJB2 TaxID=1296103 RepID=A0ABR5BTQ0_9TREE|nr:hypothetical protein I306_04088 [Cryptococcus gattii EJB2]